VFPTRRRTLRRLRPPWPEWPRTTHLAGYGRRPPAWSPGSTSRFQGFGNGRLLGVAAWLGYFATFAIVTAMVAVSFGAYAMSLFFDQGAWSGWDNAFTSVLLVGMTAINLLGDQFVSRVASVVVVVLVVVLLGVFAVFVVVAIRGIDLDLLAFSTYPSFSDIVASIALSFFAFVGFGVMTFTVGNLRDPRRQLPMAVLLADRLRARRDRGLPAPVGDRGEGPGWCCSGSL
jgi:amino acid transporter